MIRVTVELFSARDGHHEILGVAEIYNDASGTLNLGNYEYKLSQRNVTNKIWKKGSISGFPRKRLLAWDLLYRCLKDAVGDRN